MRFQFATNLYTKAMNPKQVKGYQKKIQQNKPDITLFLVTMPLEQGGFLEVYWYNSLLQPYYKTLDKELTVVGMARSKGDAHKLVKQLVEYMYQEQQDFDLNRYLLG